nr:MAG TPA: hypothetical protein [Caudoviricetes sp.]
MVLKMSLAMTKAILSAVIFFIVFPHKLLLWRKYYIPRCCGKQEGLSLTSIKKGTLF